MNWNDFNAAFEDAKRSINVARSHARQMASMISGGLCKAGVDHDDLCAMKIELQKYNMTTRKWKS